MSKKRKKQETHIELRDDCGTRQSATVGGQSMRVPVHEGSVPCPWRGLCPVHGGLSPLGRPWQGCGSLCLSHPQPYLVELMAKCRFCFNTFLLLGCHPKFL